MKLSIHSLRTALVAFVLILLSFNINANTVNVGTLNSSTTWTGTCTSSSCATRAGYDVQYQFVAGATGSYTFGSCTMSNDTYMYLSSGSCNTTSITYNDDACGTQSTITYSLTAGNTYYLLLEAYSGNLGAYTIDVTAPSAGITLACGNFNAGNLNLTTSWQNASYSAGTIPYWSFTATAGDVCSFSLCSNSEDSYLRIYNSSATLLTSNDDGGPYCTGSPASLDWTCSTTGTYYVTASHYSCSAFTNSGSMAYRKAGASTPCSEAINIPSAPVNNQSVVCTSTSAPGNLSSANVTSGCGGASTSYMGGQEALYTYTPTTSGTHTISYNGQSWSAIFVYSGACPASGGTCVGGVSGSGTSQSIDVIMTAGTLYYIWFDTYPSPYSPCPGTFSLTPPSAPGSNINMSNGSTTIICGNTYNFYDSGGASSEYTNSQNLTHTFTSSNGSPLTITFTSFNTESSWDKMTIYNGVGTGGTILLNAYSGTTIPASVTSTGSSLTVLFTSDGSNTRAGWVATVTCSSVTGGCGSATPMSCGITYSGSIASSDPNTISTCAIRAGGERVYSFTPTTTGSHTFNYAQTSGDPDFFLTDVCGAAGSFCERTNADSGTDTYTRNLTAGTTYYLIVQNNSGASTFTVSVTCPGATGPCGSAITLQCGVSSTANLTSSGGAWTNYTGTGLSYNGTEQVWSFTAPTTGSYTFNVAQGANDADFFLMSACSNTSTNLSSGYWSGSGSGTTHTVTLIAGTTYYLIADLYSSSGSTTVTVSVTCPGGGPVTNCVHSICLHDTYGDGWSGGSVSVSVGGVTVVNSQTLSSGSGPTCFNFNVTNGQPISISYSAGSWSSENYYRVYSGASGTGSLLYGSPSGSTPPSFQTVTANCSSVTPPPIDCESSMAFCTTDAYTFPASTGVPSLGQVGCLYTTPNPAWYWMEIADPGPIDIFISSGADVDYIAWGPFSSLAVACASDLMSNSGVSCSYSAASTETAHIPNGQPGEVYVLLITNYANVATNISFSHSGGSGTTNCDIVAPPVSNNGPLCVGDNLQLSVNFPVTGATYSWTGPNGFTSSLMNPTINNVTTAHAGVYSLVVTVGGNVSLPESTTVVVNPWVTPNFAAVGSYCSGATIPALPTTSTNGVTGTWSPAINNTATTAYTFTPTAGQCALTRTLTIIITPNTTPTFSAVGPYCSGAFVPSLPTTSNNGVTGTWSPAINNTATTVYTFTPSGSQCATTATLTITITPNVIPTFAAVGPYCSGDFISALPTTSNNGVTGTWSPAINSTTTTTYTFTPSVSQCAIATTLTIIVNPSPTISDISATPATICLGDASNLNATSTGNSINWYTQPTGGTTIGSSASGNNFAVSPGSTTTYYAEATSVGGVGGTQTFNYTGGVQTWTVPNGVTSISVDVYGAQGGAGSYSGGKGGYATGDLAVTTGEVINIYVGQSPSGISAGWNGGGSSGGGSGGGGGASDIRVGGTSLSNRIIVAGGGGGGGHNGSSGGTTYTGTVGGYGGGLAGQDSPPANSAIGYGGTQSAGGISAGCLEIGTFGSLGQGGNGNVNSTFSDGWSGGGGGGYYGGGGGATCGAGSGGGGGSGYIGGVTSGSMSNDMRSGNGQILITYSGSTGCTQTTRTPVTVTVMPDITPTFTAVGPYCSGATIPALPTTSNNGISGTWSPAINNTATTTYTFTPNGGQCAATTTLTITITPNEIPTFTAVGPYCSGATIPALPTTSNNGISGTWSPAINNTTTTVYTFTPAAGQCALTQTLTIPITPNIIPTFAAVGPYCSGATIPALSTTSTNGITGTWSPAINNTATTTVYTFTPAAGQCATTATLTIAINPNITPTFAAVGPFCSGATIGALPTTSINGYTGTWSPAINNTATTVYTFTPTAGQCATTASLTITINDNPIATATGNNLDCNGDNSGSIDVSISNGTPNYYIDWVSGNTTTALSNYTISSLSQGTYNIAVTDANGCTDDVIVTI
ncbi:MAG: glycine-rich protein, partial [Bacteroidales bacterium]|nr:glycine-rich protein [Bacteroidales bacterium]